MICFILSVYKKKSDDMELISLLFLGLRAITVVFWFKEKGTNTIIL